MTLPLASGPAPVIDVVPVMVRFLFITPVNVPAPSCTSMAVQLAAAPLDNAPLIPAGSVALTVNVHPDAVGFTAASAVLHRESRISRVAIARAVAAPPRPASPNPFPEEACMLRPSPAPCALNTAAPNSSRVRFSSFFCFRRARRPLVRGTFSAGQRGRSTCESAVPLDQPSSHKGSAALCSLPFAPAPALCPPSQAGLDLDHCSSPFRT